MNAQASIKDVFHSWKKIYELEKKAEAMLMTLTSHPDTTDEQILAATRIRAAARAEFKDATYRTSQWLQGRGLSGDTSAMTMRTLMGGTIYEPLPAESIEKMRHKAQLHLQQLQSLQDAEAAPMQDEATGAPSARSTSQLSL